MQHSQMDLDDWLMIVLHEMPMLSCGKLPSLVKFNFVFLLHKILNLIQSSDMIMVFQMFLGKRKVYGIK